MRTFTAALCGLALAGQAGAALAHIALAETAAPPGGYYAGFFRVSHGCDASATVALKVSIPEGIVIAHPQPKPGWTLSVETAPLARPVISEGVEVTTRVSAITWAGRLPADQFDQFGVMLKLPADEGSIYFPTVQTCETGENRWVEIPAAGAAWTSVKRPAPVLTLTADAASPAPAHAHH